MNLYQKYLNKAKESTKKDMFQEYKDFILKTTKDQTIEYLQVMEPGRLKVIQKAMQQLDHHFNNKNHQGFKETITEARKEIDYLNAL